MHKIFIINFINRAILLIAGLFITWFFFSSRGDSNSVYLFSTVGLFLLYLKARTKVNKILGELEVERNALKEELELNKIFSRITNDVIWDCNLLTNVIVYNDNYHFLLGYDAKNEGNTNNWKDYIHPEDEERVITHIDKVIKGNDSIWTDEYRFIRKDGTVAYIFDRAHIYRDIEGKAFRMVGCMMDITHHEELKKQAMVEIIRNEEKFRFLADSIPHKIWTTAPGGEITYVNNRWLEYTNCSTLEEFSTKVPSVFHTEDKEKVDNTWKEVKLSGNKGHFEYRIRNHKGEYRWHQITFNAQKDDNGIIMWVGSCTDIHEQKVISDALKISEAHFRELANQNSIIIWKANASGYTTYINKTWEKYTGIKAKESLGNSWTEVIHPEDREKAFRKFKINFEQRKPFQSKYRLRLADGTYRWFLNHGNPIMDPDFVGYIGSITDIHEQELKKQSIEALMRQKDEFLSIASHELKTPITSMKASLQIIERIAGNNRELDIFQSHVGRASKQINKLTGLVEDLLDVTKIQAGKMQLNLTEFSIETLTIDCIQEFQPWAVNHNIKIQGGTGITIKADKFRIEQVINNLLSNAVKYSPGADEVLVSLKIKDYKLYFSVTDFGIGIPKEKIEQIFNRFYRVQESAHKFSGLGLGLFISKEIIKRHGGEMGVISYEGQRSTFWFSLPINKQLDLNL